MPDDSDFRDPASVQQVRERVLQLARNIEELSQSDLSPQRFFTEFLQLLVGALGAQAGAIWMRGPGGGLNLVCDVRLAETQIGENPQASQLNGKLLSDVMATGQASAHSPDDQGVALPTQNLIILAALQTESEPVGVVEVFQRPDSPLDARPGYLQFVEQMAGYASRYLERHQETAAGDDSADFWEGFEEYVLQLQRSLNLDEVAATAANDGRYLLRCDRMSVAVKRGKKTVVKAISGQDAVNQRSNLVVAMTRLASKIIPMREPVVYSGKVDHLPEPVMEPLAAYVQESNSRMVMVVPLFETEPLVKSDDDDPKGRGRLDRRGKSLGCLVIEQASKSQPQPRLLREVDLIADHVAAALHNARTHQRVFLLPVWKFLGSCLEWFHGRKLAKTLAILSAVVAVCFLMAFVTLDYRVEGVGRLMPVIQREVFAPWDGEVVEIFVEGGERVKAGQQLLRLRNDELTAKLLESRNELNQKQQTLLALQAQLDDAVKSADRDEEIRVQGRLVETIVEIQGLEEQVGILAEREKLLTVCAPIDGIVATFQVEQLLQNRPVRRGEILVEVMDDKQEWHLELEVEEHRLGHILRAQKKRDKLREEKGLDKNELLVEFVLATASESTFEGHLKRIATRSVTSTELGSVVEVFVSTHTQDLPNRRIGAEVSAKINCGQKSMYYVFFGDIIEFVQKRFWL